MNNKFGRHNKLLLISLLMLVFQVSTVAQTATIYLDSTRQVIRGFGAANILPWRPDMTTDEISKAFGTDEGQIGFTLLRLRVPYQQSEFSLNIPTALAAQNMGAQIIASPWTPPPWMKTNNDPIGGRLNDTSYASYAAHLKSFGDFLASNGVELEAISVQNEPDIQVTYESCDWNASEMLRFMKENAPSVGYPVFVPESYQFIKTISDSILNDPVATANTAFIGGHIYGGGIEPYPLAESEGKELWMTEHLDTDTSWSHVLATGKEINDCMIVGMSAYIWWYIVRFYGPIDENGNVTKRGFVMSQYAKFIRPGYFRIDAVKSPAGGIYISAYKNSSKIVLIAINYSTSPRAQTFVLEGGSVPKFLPYTTSQTKNCSQGSEILVSGNSFTDTLDALSITTFVSEGAVGIEELTSVPIEFHLYQNYPNPFNPSTQIKYSLGKSGNISLKVYNLLGEEVATLYEGFQKAGSHTVSFDGSGLSSGVYIYRLSAGNLSESKKLILLK